MHAGLCLMSLGDLDQSVAALMQATKLDPKLQDAWFGLAHCEKEVSCSLSSMLLCVLSLGAMPCVLS